jgi:hypothetical protein
MVVVLSVIAHILGENCHFIPVESNLSAQTKELQERLEAHIRSRTGVVRCVVTVAGRERLQFGERNLAAGFDDVFQNNVPVNVRWHAPDRSSD